MANKISYKLPKPSDLDIFSTQADRNAAVRTQVENIPIDLIDSFPDHPYSVRDSAGGIYLGKRRSEPASGTLHGQWTLPDGFWTPQNARMYPGWH